MRGRIAAAAVRGIDRGTRWGRCPFLDRYSPAWKRHRGERVTDVVSGLARRAALLVATTTLLVAGATSAGTSAAAGRGGGAGDAGRAGVTASGSLAVVVPRPAVPPGFRAVGPAAVSTPVSGAVALAPADRAGLQAFAAAVTDPRSPLYRHYLPAGVFRGRFAPDAGAVAAVVRTLRAAGLTVDPTPLDGLLLGFHGPAGRVEAAFHTTLVRFRRHDGLSVLAATSAVRLPASVAQDVLSVLGLDDLLRPHRAQLQGGSRMSMTLSARRSAAPAGMRPRGSVRAPVACGTAKAAATADSGLTDDRLAAAYGLDRLYAVGDNGSGQTVALIELEGFARSDLTNFDDCYFGAAGPLVAAHVHVVAVDGGAQTGWGTGEAALDVENLSALAPGATIDVYEAPDDAVGYLEQLALVVADGVPIISSSWSTGCEAQVAASQPGLMQVENVLFEQAASQGQTFLGASGDSGSEGCTVGSSPGLGSLGLGVEDPASQPYVLAVGGTTVTTASFPPVETAWNDGSGASGGGISHVWPAPAWQIASGVPGVDSPSVVAQAEQVSGTDFCNPTPSGPPCRELPDVSADADPDTNGLTVYYDGGWTVIGGTSSATPQWAAVLADIAASPACAATPANGPGGTGLGFAPPLLYQVASSPSEYAGAFSDVVSGNNDALGVDNGLYPATAGFDMATGLGSPLVTDPGGGPGLATDLCAARAQTAPTVLQVVPGAVPDSATSTLTVTGTAFSAGCSTVAVGSWVAPASDVTVDGPTQLTVYLPAHATGPAPAASGAGNDTGTYDVTVGCAGGPTSGPTPAARLDVYATAGHAPVPTVAAVEPSGGPLSGGTIIRVYGSGFADGGGVTAVTVGGVPARDVQVLSDTQLTARVPVFTAGATACLAGDAGAAVDVCQTEVRVRVGDLTSPAAPLTPELRGAIDNIAPTTPGFAPAPTEFDYLPVPTLGSLRVDGTSPYASEMGGSEVTVHGTGLGVLGLEWMDVGPPGLATSADVEWVSDTGTAVTFLLPSTSMTRVPLRIEVAAQTLASPARILTSDAEPSRPVSVTYAPTPEVTRVLTDGHRQVGPVGGGTPMVVQGSGFLAQPYVQFADVHGGPSVAEQYHVVADRADPGGQLSLLTPRAQRGVDQVSVCNISGCSSEDNPRTRFIYFPPGAPLVTSVSPPAGPAGRRVVIRGSHLGYVERVLFGSRPARTFANPVDSRGLVSEWQIVAVVPAGDSGTVQVRVVTAESLDSHHPESPPAPGARFRYG